MLSQANVYLEALAKVLPIILMLLAGVALQRTQFITSATVEELKKLVVNITLPALLFLAFSQVDLQPRYLLISTSVFVACLAILLLGNVVRPVVGVDTDYFPVTLTGFEAGMMGYAIFSAVYGQENIFKFGIVDLGQVVFVFFIMVPVLERYASGAKSFFSTVSGFFKTPVILGILGGIVFNQLGLMETLSDYPLGASVLETLRLLGAMTTPLVTIAIGYEIQFRSGSLWRPSLTIGLRLAVWVLIGLLLNLVLVRGVLELDPVFQAAVMTMFILPPPFIIPLFMSDAQPGDRNYVTNTLTVATVATLFAFSVVTVLYPAP